MGSFCCGCSIKATLAKRNSTIVLPQDFPVRRSPRSGPSTMGQGKKLNSVCAVPLATRTRAHVFQTEGIFKV